MAAGFRVVAIVAAYNEADVIATVVADLIAQGVDVYLLDDGSTDGTVAAVLPFVGRGVLAIEQMRAGADPTPDAPFEWTRILERKIAVARTIDADWFVHHDADELRESPWSGVTFSEAVRRVDAAGFNAVEFTSLDFWPVHDRFQPGDDLRAAFTHYAEHGPYDRVQVRAWKNTGAAVDLSASGGHDARFEGRRVFPLRFISRHYPIRSQAHGERKVFHERRGRFLPAERALGWHVQYDAVQMGAAFVRDPATLTRYDPDAIRLSLALRHRDLESLERQLHDAHQTIDAQRRELDARDREIDLRRSEIDRHRQELERHQRELAGARRASEATAASLAASEAESAARGRAIEEAAAFVAHQANAVADLQAALDDQVRTIATMRRSFSWRMTAPMRALARVVSGR